MKANARCIGKTLLLCAVVMAFWPLILAQSAPTLLNFQGRLTNAVGAPVTVPTGVRFTLLRGGTATETISTGTTVYQEDATVTPDGNGVFAHVIGTGTAVGSETLIEADFDTSGVALFVEMAIGGTPLLPRTRVMSVPYAIEASRVGGMTAQAIIGQSGGNAFANAVVRNGAGLEWQSASAITVKPGTLGFPDGVVRRNTASLTWSFANPLGPLGLDQGTETANTWYYLYAVPDPNDNTKFSAVASTGTPPQIGGTGPVGYGVSRYLGSVRNDASSDILRSQMLDNSRFQYSTTRNQETGVGPATFTNGPTLQNLSAFIPATASAVVLIEAHFGVDAQWRAYVDNAGIITPGTGVAWNVSGSGSAGMWSGVGGEYLIPTPTIPKGYWRYWLVAQWRWLDVVGWVDPYVD